MSSELTRTEKQEIIEKFLKHFSNANVQAALYLLDESATWRAMGQTGCLPMSGEMDRQAIGALITNVNQSIPAGLKLTPLAWTVEDNRVALEMESCGELTNGRIYNNRYHFLIELRDQRIRSIREYMDTLHVKETFVD